MFGGLTSLQYLNLRGNQLTTLPADVFDGLTSLQRLSLSGICDRTPQVRDAILEALATDDCAAVDISALHGRGHFCFALTNSPTLALGCTFVVRLHYWRLRRPKIGTVARPVANCP